MMDKGIIIMMSGMMRHGGTIMTGNVRHFGCRIKLWNDTGVGNND